MDTIEPDFLDPEPIEAHENYGITIPHSSRGTLDESIFSTFQRDYYEIHGKLRKVVFPNFPIGSTDSHIEQVFQGTDLWAPLFFIILYSFFTSHGHRHFSGYFLLSWLLIGVMATHLKLMKPHEHMSWMSYVSLSGYCLFPLMLESVMCSVLLPLLLKIPAINKHFISLVIVAKLASFALFTTWSVVSICRVSNSQMLVERYPLLLCLVTIGWITVIQ